MATLAGYSFRKEIDLTGAAGLGTNSHVLLKVGATSSATGEDFDLGGRCSSFPTDIRFTDNDGETELDFYLEKTTGSGDTALAHLWVEVADSMETSATIYIYYGKSGDTSGSSGDDTFLLFEDFEDLTTGSALAGQGGWVDAGGTAANLTVEANQAVSGSNSAENTKSGDANVYKAFTATANVGAVFNIRSSADDAGSLALPRVLLYSDANLKVQFQVDGTADDLEYLDSVPAAIDILNPYSADTWYRLEGRFRASDDNGNWRYDSQAFAGMDDQRNTWTTLNRIQINTNNAENAYFDQIFIYKVATDGSVGAFNTAGEEEQFVSIEPMVVTVSIPPTGDTNLTPVSLNPIVVTVTIPPPTPTESGGWTEQTKNTSSWTNITKN